MKKPQTASKFTLKLNETLCNRASLGKRVNVFFFAFNFWQKKEKKKRISDTFWLATFMFAICSLQQNGNGETVEACPNAAQLAFMGQGFCSRNQFGHT